MGYREIPISQVRPTHSGTKLVKFTNISSEDFVHAVGGKRFLFKKEKAVLLAENLAYHFARNLAQKMIFENDDSLMKYAQIDAQKDRERIAKGENPAIKSVGKEIVDKLIKDILNGHEVQQVAMPTDDEIADATELGMAVPEKKAGKKEGKEDSKVKKEEEVEEEGDDFNLDEV